MNTLSEDEQLYLDAKNAYYNTGTTIMSDVEFDLLENKLKKINSPVIRQVGFSNNSKRKKINHLSPMLSLSKISTTNDEVPPDKDAQKWFNKIKVPIIETSPKYDGNSASVVYDNNGIFLYGLSRGDGLIGQDISSKISEIVPYNIGPHKFKYVEMRGEVLIPLNIFNKKYAHKFKNARNFVAGVLNSDTPNIKVVRDLIFIPYDVREYKNNTEFIYPKNLLESLKKYKFKELPEIVLIQPNITAFNKIFHAWNQYRKTKSPVQLDGFVMKVIDNNRRNELGENSHDPEWGLAVKFAPKLVTTIVNDIEWKMGKTGELTPIAVLKPVDLDGSNVQRATMHNVSYILDKKCYPGAIVSLHKSGDIIPQIQSILKESKYTYNIPDKCPHCNSLLKIKDDIHLICPNPMCSGKQFYRFLYGVNVLELDGFGDSTIKQIFENMDEIKTPFDLFNPNKFNKDTLVYKGGFPDGKKVRNFIKEIQKKKVINLQTTLLMMGIPNLGKSVSKELAKKLAGKEYSEYGLEKRFFQMFEKGTREYNILSKGIETLRKNGIRIVLTKEKKGIKFEMTGSPFKSGFKSKDEFIKFALLHGYAHASLNKDCQLLLTDNYNSTSGKMQKAMKLNIEIITYEDFIKKFN